MYCLPEYETSQMDASPQDIRMQISKSSRVLIKPPGTEVNVIFMLALSQLEHGENVGPCPPPWTHPHTPNTQQMHAILPSPTYILLSRLLYIIALLKWWQSQGRTNPTANSLRSKNHDAYTIFRTIARLRQNPAGRRRRVLTLWRGTLCRFC